jgi:hypothetical protein
MDRKDIRGLSLGQYGTSLEGRGSHDLGVVRGHKGLEKRPTCIVTVRARPTLTHDQCHCALLQHHASRHCYFGGTYCILFFTVMKFHVR